MNKRNVTQKSNESDLTADESTLCLSVLLRFAAMLGYKPTPATFAKNSRRTEILNLCRFILRKLGVDSEISEIRAAFENE
ncbi:hypothetical protein DRP04_05870, partial [Archaeoglobales archaeon]